MSIHKEYQRVKRRSKYDFPVWITLFIILSSFHMNSIEVNAFGVNSNSNRKKSFQSNSPSSINSGSCSSSSCGSDGNSNSNSNGNNNGNSNINKSNQRNVDGCIMNGGAAAVLAKQDEKCKIGGKCNDTPRQGTNVSILTSTASTSSRSRSRSSTSSSSKTKMYKNKYMMHTRKTAAASSSSASFALQCSPADDMAWDPTFAPKLDYDVSISTIRHVLMHTHTQYIYIYIYIYIICVCVCLP